MSAVLQHDDDEQPVIPESSHIIEKGGQKPSSHVLPMHILKQIQRLGDGIVNGYIQIFIENREYVKLGHYKEDLRKKT